MAKLDVGDAVLTFYGDTGQLDAALAAIPEKTAAALTPAQSSMTELAQTMVNTGQAGTSLADAFKLIPPPVQQSDVAVQNMAFSLKSLTVATQEAAVATEESAGSYKEARGEIMLLGDATGVKLPRHVASFVAGLGPIQGLLSGAFAATAVLFIIDAFVKVAEKIAEMQKRGEELDKAFQGFQNTISVTLRGLDDKLLQSGAALDNLRGDHVAALRKELELINDQSLDRLSAAFKQIAGAADQMFSKLAASWMNLEAGSTGAQAALNKFNLEYQTLLEHGEKEKAAQLLQGTLHSAEQMQQKMKDANTSTAAWVNTAVLGGTAAATVVNRVIGYTHDQVMAQDTLVLALQATEKAQKSIDDNASVEKKIKEQTEYNRVLSEQEKILVAGARETQKEVDLADKMREQKRQEAIRNLETQNQERLALTKTGSQARLTVIEDEIKKMESLGLQDEASYRSLQVEKVKAVQAMTDAEEKAISTQLNSQLKEVAKEGKEELAEISANYKERETAIAQLASMHLITERQKEQRLLAMYRQEGNETIRILQQQLATQQRIMAEAQARVQKAEGNPLFTDVQLANLKKNLATAEGAILATETTIAKEKEKFEAEALKNQKDEIGKAIALYTAMGDKIHAQQLIEHQGDLLLLQDKIRLAQARGQDTKAMQEQEKELQKETQAIIQQVHSVNLLKAAWQQTTVEIVNDAQKAGDAVSSMADEMKKSVDTAASDMASMFEAMGAGAVSVGTAIKEAMKKLVSDLAKQWGEYFIKLGIANLIMNPAIGALEIAAGAGLMALAGAMGGGSSASTSKSSSSTSTAPTLTQSAGNTTAAGPVQSTVNVPHLADGGIVMSPTTAVVGDAPGGEAIIPLRSGAALSELATALAAKMQNGMGAGTGLKIHLQSDIPLTVRKITQQVNKGQARLLASNSIRVTRRSV